jgi:hypothetical protein
MRNNRVLLSHLLIESIAEEYNVDEGLKDILKKGAVVAALGTAGAVGAYKAGKSLLNKGDSDSQKVYNIKDEVPMTHEEVLSRQAFKESRLDPNAVSPRGAKGLTQIMPSALEDYLKATGKKIEDVNLMDIRNSIDIQVQTMKSLYNSSFINKEKEGQTEVVRLAKTLAAYNYGRGNLSSLLNKIKEEGKIDIYNSLDWLDKLPLETSDYVKKILLKKDPKFEREYQKSIKSDKNKKIVSYYKKIKGFK